MPARRCPEHPGILVDSLKSLKDRNRFCDVTIIAGDEEIKAHRLVLVASSKYFEAMFMNDTNESKTGIVQFPDTPKEVVKQCIEFIYSGNVKFPLESISEFMKTSDIFGVKNLTNLYIKFLAENVDLDNILEILSVVRTYKLEELKESIQDYFHEHFSSFVKSKTYILLDEDWILYLASLVNDFSQEHEMLKWTMILTWVKQNLTERESVFFGLFCAIDLSFFSKKFINEDIMNETLVSDCNDCLRHLFDFAHNGKQRQDSGRRKSTVNRLLSCNPKTKLLYQYDVRKENWSRLIQLPDMYTEFLDITEYSGSIYIGNGWKMWRYDGAQWICLYTGNYGVQEMYNVCFGFGDFITMACQKYTVVFNLSSLKTFGSG